MKKYLKNNKDAIISTMTSIFSIILAIFSSFLYDYIKKHFNQSFDFILIPYIIFNIYLIYKISQLVCSLRNKFLTDSEDNFYVQRAFVSMKSLENSQGEQLQKQLKGKSSISSELLVTICINNITSIVNQCYEFFDNTFSTGDLVKPISFEVTFMTKSYQDKEITIPAARNRERTQPCSMLKRQTNKLIYSNTVSAEVYSEYENGKKPQMHIISDTNSQRKDSNQKEYHFIYEGQGDRIKSSIVLPIISHKNELLGTLVVHCNQPNFFKQKKEDFWRELLDIFSVEIAKEKIYLDILVENCHADKPF